MDEPTAAATETVAPETTTPSVETTAPVTTTTEVQPAATETKEPQFDSAKDPREYLREKISWNEAQKAKPETTPEVKPAEPVAESKPAEEAKTDAEKKPDAEKPAEAKTEETAVDPLDKIGPLPAEKIAAALKTDPALEEALDKAGLSKDALIASAREAAQASQFKELFPTVEIAQMAKQGSENFAILDEQFPAIKSAQDYDKFMMDTLVPMSYIRDENGNPVPDQQMPGAFKTDGSVARFIKMSNDVEFGQIQRIGDLMLANGAGEDQKEYAQNLKAAVDFIQDFRNNGYRMPGTPGEKVVIPPDVQERLDRADARERELNEREASQRAEQVDAFEGKVTDATVEQVSPLIKDVLDKTSFSDKIKGKIAESVWQKLADTLAANRLFGQAADRMMSRRELTDAIRKERVDHNVKSMKAIYLDILRKEIEDWGGEAIAANQALHTKLDTQKQAARMEPKTGAVATTSATAVLSDDQVHSKAVEQAKAKNRGQDPSPAQIYQELLEIRKLRPTA